VQTHKPKNPYQGESVKKKVKGAAIFCPAPEIEGTGDSNLWKHIKTHLIPPHEIWVPIPQLGGPLSLVYTMDLAVELACFMKQIAFVLKEFDPEEFMVVHHKCGYYKNVPRLHPTEENMVTDLGLAGHVLLNRFKLPVRAHFRVPHAPHGFHQIPVH